MFGGGRRNGWKEGLSIGATHYGSAVESVSKFVAWLMKQGFFRCPTAMDSGITRDELL